MRALITGGAGFIGSHLAERLLEGGHRVTALDDLSTGSIENVRHLRAASGFELVVEDCTDVDVVDALVAEADVVYHLAAAVGVELIIQSPVRTIETNVHATEVVLAAAARHLVPVLVASTSEVYGKSTALPFAEDGDIVLGATTKGRWSYACSKAIDEFLALAYHRERQLPTVVVRLFNTVGPRQTGRYGMVLPTFVRAALAGRPLRVFGDGSQTRCFCHVQDVVRALDELMVDPRHAGQVFNVGATDEISIERLAARVIERAGSSSVVERVAYQDAYVDGFEDMARRLPDIAKITRTLGWAPSRSTDQIIDDVLLFERTSGSE